MMGGMDVLPFFGARECETVRAATTSDLGALADELVDVTNLVDRSKDPRADTLLGDASACYERAEQAFDRAERTDDFAEITAQIGRGRFLLEAIRARLKAVTPSDQMQPCFFDPAHGPAGRLVAWTPPGGDPRTVPVCDPDGDLVEDDVQPEPRKVVVSGCSPEDLLAGMPLGEAFVRNPLPANDNEVSREEIRDRWSEYSAEDGE